MQRIISLAERIRGSQRIPSTERIKRKGVILEGGKRYNLPMDAMPKPFQINCYNCCTRTRHPVLQIEEFLREPCARQFRCRVWIEEILNLRYLFCAFLGLLKAWTFLFPICGAGSLSYEFP